VSGETVYFPSTILDLSVGSNGMCAGNTPGEALIQGLSEIYERYVLMRIHTDENIILPVVPDIYLKEMRQWDCVHFIRSKGYEVYVKDCSLGGLFPVVGVLLVKDGKALFNLGAALNFSIALERCITETLQGVLFDKIDRILQPIDNLYTRIPEKTFSTKEKQIQFQYFTSLLCGQGIVPPAVFDHSERFDKALIQNDDDLTSDSAWRTMLNKAIDAGYDVYCRDVSFLGFNSYRIYVRGISEVMNIDCELIPLLSQRFKPETV